MDLLNEVMKNYLKEKGINGNSKVSGTDVAKLIYNFTSEQLRLHGVGVPKGTLCNCQDNFEEDRDTKGNIICGNCKKRVFA